MVVGWLDGKNTVINKLVERLEALEETIKTLQVEKLTQIKRIESLENELKKSNSSNSNNTYGDWAKMLIHNTKKTETQTNILNAVGNEQKERKSKENKMIVFGVPTSTATDEIEKQKDDTKIVTLILNELGFKCDDIEKTVRFKPKNGSNKPPPIRVEFIKKDRAHDNEEILKAAKKLKNSTNYKNIGISNDLTDSQLIQIKNNIKTRNELNSKLKDTDNYRYGIRGDRVVKVDKLATN